MKKLPALILALVAVMAFSLSAFATPTGGLGIYGVQNPSNTDRCKVVPGFQITTMYLVGFNLGDITGWEGALTLSDLAWNVTSTTIHGPAPVNVGSGTNYIVGLGGVVNGSPRYTFITWQLGYFVAPTAPRLTMCMGPSSPSTFNPPSPGYATSSDVLIPFTLTEDDPQGNPYNDVGCAILNPEAGDDCVIGLSATDASFGALKAKF